MSNERDRRGKADFERQWLDKLGRSIEKRAGVQARAAVLRGSEGLSDASPREEVIAWTRSALERLQECVGEKSAQSILTGCSCEYPRVELAPIRRRYAETGDLDLAHRLLQEKFEGWLSDSLGLAENSIEEIRSLGWGLAGRREGDTIVATKIPKSGNLSEYLREQDPEKKRQAYCHCPRMRSLLGQGGQLPAVYCYCGAGFYKGIWEEILQRPVEVELLESVLQGGEVCRVAIHLPEDA